MIENKLRKLKLLEPAQSKRTIVRQHLEGLGFVEGDTMCKQYRIYTLKEDIKNYYVIYNASNDSLSSWGVKDKTKPTGWRP